MNVMIKRTYSQIEVACFMSSPLDVAGTEERG